MAECRELEKRRPAKTTGKMFFIFLICDSFGIYQLVYFVDYNMFRNLMSLDQGSLIHTFFWGAKTLSAITGFFMILCSGLPGRFAIDEVES